MSELTICNNDHDQLRVIIKDEGEELVLSRGEVACVFATGAGSHCPMFTLATMEGLIAVEASHAESVLLQKETPKSAKDHMHNPGLWDRELDAGF